MFACLHLAGAASAAPLVALAQDFSPRFEVVSASAVLVDISGLDRLVGDADAVGAAMARLARQRELAVTPALAPTRTAAMLLALAGTRARASPGAYRLRVSAHTAGAVAAALAPLPISLLAALHDLEHGENPLPAPSRRRRAAGVDRGRADRDATIDWRRGRMRRQAARARRPVACVTRMSRCAISSRRCAAGGCTPSAHLRRCRPSICSSGWGRPVWPGRPWRAARMPVRSCARGSRIPSRRPRRSSGRWTRSSRCRSW